MEDDLKRIEKGNESCCEVHQIMVCDPEYDGHHKMEYYEDLWGGLVCVKEKCSNKGLSVGQLIKKKIKVHYCKHSQNYEGELRCLHMICDHCMQKESESKEGSRGRCKRRRNK